MTRLGRVLWWALPSVFFVWAYWFGLRAWFQQDDFAWLGQRLAIYDWRSFLAEMFEPRAQGTLRPWSERLFFIVMYDRFGLDHRAYHAVVAATQVCNLLMLQFLVWRMTASRVAAVSAPVLWLCGIGLATPISWASAYNEVLCAFFLLSALLLLVLDRFWCQTVVFVLGFGALELNVVYPALAAGWLYLYRREELRRSLYLFAISLGYTILHFKVAPNPKEGPYAQYWDGSILKTLLGYCGTALSGGEAGPRRFVPEGSWVWFAWGLGVLVVAFAAWSWWKKDRLPAYGLFWFGVVLGPVLPLRDHVMDYYLAIPSIGLAVVLGVMLQRAFERGIVYRVVAAGLVLAHIGYCLPVSRGISYWRYERGHRFRALMEGLERAQELHPGQMLVVKGLDSEMFWSCFMDRGYRIYGVTGACIAPGDEKGFEAHPELGDVTQFVCDSSALARGVSNGLAQVYQFEGTVLRRITRSYGQRMPAEWFESRPGLIQVGLPLFERDLGVGWNPSEGDWRWMGQAAEVSLAAPGARGAKVEVAGFQPGVLAGREVLLRVLVNGQLAGSVALNRAEEPFEVQFPVSDQWVGAKELKIRLELDRVLVEEAGGRRLGMPIRHVALR